MSITARQILSSAPDRFRAEKAQDIHSVFHFMITGEENFEVALIIDNGACTLSEGLHGKPTCVVKTSAKTYIELETGKANPQMALMTGKVKVSDIPEMIRFAKCFRKFEPKALIPSISQGKIRSKRTGPLEGVKIIDFTRLLPGPMATMMLADMGADVIKVEDPGSPDYVRGFEPMIEGTSAFYYALNRNKKSLAVNFLSEEGKTIITQLVKTADILIEQYRPGVMKKIGLNYETMRSINPSLIYISITGYGQDTGMSHAAGHDVNYISIAGSLGTTVDDNGAPVIPGFQLADIAGGSYMAISAVTAALYRREKTHKGEYIDLAMTDSVLPFIALPFAEYQATNELRKGKFQLSGSLANYNVYKCGDGKYIALGALEPKFWNTICDRIGKPEWQEKILADEATQSTIKKELQKIFSSKKRDEWLGFFSKDDVCVTAVNDLSEIAADKYLNERKMFVDFQIGGTQVRTIAQPIKFSDAIGSDSWVAPQLGEDTYTILKELQYTDENITDMTKKNIVKSI